MSDLFGSLHGREISLKHIREIRVVFTCYLVNKILCNLIFLWCRLSGSICYRSVGQVSLLHGLSFNLIQMPKVLLHNASFATSGLSRRQCFLGRFSWRTWGCRRTWWGLFLGLWSGLLLVCSFGCFTKDVTLEGWGYSLPHGCMVSTSDVRLVSSLWCLLVVAYLSLYKLTKNIRVLIRASSSLPRTFSRTSWALVILGWLFNLWLICRGNILCSR